ncbi:MAG: hypothetical protein JOZ13_17320 [Alphaproteobacteria bacterium]|nr:hypothetical protein [Alphaproteobacteria bacterium]
MAFGIDDALMVAAAGISLTDTIVETIKRNKKEKKDYDLELLIEQARVTALERIDAADLALIQFERMMADKVDIKKPLSRVIAETPPWKPWESFRLKQMQKSFNYMWDSIYCAGDDIAALLRCRQHDEQMGIAVVESTGAKRDLHERLLAAPSLKEAISILRTRLEEHKKALLS